MGDAARAMQVEQIDERDSGWAQRQAGDRLTYAVVRDDAERERANPGSGRGLVWLVAIDGNDTSDMDSAGRDVQRRMLRRRQTPVGISEADRAPTTVLDPYSDRPRRP